MDNTRENLIELLKSAYGTSFNAPHLAEHEIEPLADHLIANGVTVQEWIPVTERLPEENDDVLCYRGNHIGALMDVYTYKGDGKWEDSYGYWNYTDIEGITHWMPLPQAPKEG